MSHQSWLEQPYTDAAKEQEEYEYWCEHQAEDKYDELLTDGDDVNYIPYAAPAGSIALFKVSGVIPAMRPMTFDEWLDDTEGHWRYFEEWCEEVAKHGRLCRCPDCA